ncbi:MAG: endonuclease Q family protein [Candidatus Buchananbacteria bacterium]
MRQIADLHLHSKYSRATSKDLDLEHLELWSKIKGLQIIGTGDFTHPAWFKDLATKLVEVKSGLYQLSDNYKIKLTQASEYLTAESYQSPVYFLPSAEISCIYKQGEKTRRIHLVILAPNLVAVAKLNERLNKIGNLRSDGRPILGWSAKNLLELILEVDANFMVIPAHIWTPWFSLFGSKSGFDTVAECFGDLAKHIFAMETGLSSDPAMNWRLSALDQYTLVSNSDAHSLRRLGREANVWEIAAKDLSYREIYRILKERDQEKFLYTIEFFPEEGRYHWDGHAACQKSYPPSQSRELNKLCPVCRKPLTIGVLSRVEELADRPVDFKANRVPYKSLVSLEQIIGEALEKTPTTKAVAAVYQKLVKFGGGELPVLLDLTAEQLATCVDSEVIQAILAVRASQVKVKPGYDGVYGEVKISLNKPNKALKQKSLFG